MKRLTVASSIRVFSVIPLLLIILSAVAQSNDYNLDWWTVDSGCQAFRADGVYSLGGTIGQPDANIVTGDGYTLIGGFWGGAVVEYLTYLPVVLRTG